MSNQEQSGRSVLVQTTLRVAEGEEEGELIVVSDRGCQTVTSVSPDVETSHIVPLLEYTPFSEIVNNSIKVYDLPKKYQIQFELHQDNASICSPRRPSNEGVSSEVILKGALKKSNDSIPVIEEKQEDKTENQKDNQENQEDKQENQEKPEDKQENQKNPEDKQENPENKEDKQENQEDKEDKEDKEEKPENKEENLNDKEDNQENLKDKEENQEDKQDNQNNQENKEETQENQEDKTEDQEDTKENQENKEDKPEDSEICQDSDGTCHETEETPQPKEEIKPEDKPQEEIQKIEDKHEDKHEETIILPEKDSSDDLKTSLQHLQHSQAEEMKKPKQEIDCQTDLTVNPQILNEDEVANVCTQLGVQTSQTFQPSDSLTVVTEELKKYISHTKVYQSLVVDGKIVFEQEDKHGKEEEAKKGDQDENKEENEDETKVDEDLSKDDDIVKDDDKINDEEQIKDEDEIKNEDKIEDENQLKDDKIKDQKETSSQPQQNYQLNMTQEEFERNVQRILDNTVKNVYDFMAKIVDMYEKSKEPQSEETEQIVEEPIEKPQPEEEEPEDEATRRKRAFEYVEKCLKGEIPEDNYSIIENPDGTKTYKIKEDQEREVVVEEKLQISYVKEDEDGGEKIIEISGDSKDEDVKSISEMVMNIHKNILPTSEYSETDNPDGTKSFRLKLIREKKFQVLDTIDIVLPEKKQLEKSQQDESPEEIERREGDFEPPSELETIPEEPSEEKDQTGGDEGETGEEGGEEKKTDQVEDSGEEKKVASEPEDVKIEPEEVINEPEKVVEPEDDKTQLEESPEAQEEVVTQPEVETQPEIIPETQDEVVTQPEEVIPQPEQIPDTQEVITQPEEVIPQSEEITTQPEEIPETQQVVTQPEEVIPQSEEITTQPEEILDTQEAIPQQEEIIPQQEEVTTQPEDVTTQPEDVTTQPEEIQPPTSTEPSELCEVCEPPTEPPFEPTEKEIIPQESIETSPQQIQPPQEPPQPQQPLIDQMGDTQGIRQPIEIDCECGKVHDAGAAPPVLTIGDKKLRLEFKMNGPKTIERSLDGLKVKATISNTNQTIPKDNTIVVSVNVGGNGCKCAKEEVVDFDDSCSCSLPGKTYDSDSIAKSIELNCQCEPEMKDKADSCSCSTSHSDTWSTSSESYKKDSCSCIIPKEQLEIKSCGDTNQNYTNQNFTNQKKISPTLCQCIKEQLQKPQSKNLCNCGKNHSADCLFENKFGNKPEECSCEQIGDSQAKMCEKSVQKVVDCLKGQNFKDPNLLDKHIRGLEPLLKQIEGISLQSYLNPSQPKCVCVSSVQIIYKKSDDVRNNSNLREKYSPPLTIQQQDEQQDQQQDLNKACKCDMSKGGNFNKSQTPLYEQENEYNEAYYEAFEDVPQSTKGICSLPEVVNETDRCGKRTELPWLKMALPPPGSIKIQNQEKKICDCLKKGKSNGKKDKIIGDQIPLCTCKNQRSKQPLKRELSPLKSSKLKEPFKESSKELSKELPIEVPKENQKEIKPPSDHDPNCPCFKPYDPCSEIKPTKLLYNVDNYPASEDYMKPLCKMFPEEAETPCTNKTEINWDDYTLPTNVKLKGDKTKKKSPCQKAERSQKTCGVLTSIDGMSKSTKDSNLSGKSKSQSKKRSKSKIPKRDTIQNVEDVTVKDTSTTQAGASMVELELKFSEYTEIVSTVISVDGGAQDQQTVSEFSTVSDITKTLKRMDPNFVKTTLKSSQNVSTYGMMATIGSQPFMVGNQPMMGGNQPFIGGNQPFMGENQPFMGGNQPFTVGNQPFTVGNQPFTVANQPITSQTVSMPELSEKDSDLIKLISYDSPNTPLQSNVPPKLSNVGSQKASKGQSTSFSFTSQQIGINYNVNTFPIEPDFVLITAGLTADVPLPFDVDEINQKDEPKKEYFKSKCIKECLGRKQKEKMDFKSDNFNDPNLNLNQPNFKCSNLNQPNFKCSNLNQPDFKSSNLNQPNVKSSNLNQPDFKSSNLNQPNVKSSNSKSPSLKFSNSNPPSNIKAPVSFTINPPKKDSISLAKFKAQTDSDLSLDRLGSPILAAIKTVEREMKPLHDTLNELKAKIQSMDIPELDNWKESEIRNDKKSCECKKKSKSREKNCQSINVVLPKIFGPFHQRKGFENERNYFDEDFGENSNQNFNKKFNEGNQFKERDYFKDKNEYFDEDTNLNKEKNNFKKENDYLKKENDHFKKEKDRLKKEKDNLKEKTLYEKIKKSSRNLKPQIFKTVQKPYKKPPFCICLESIEDLDDETKVIFRNNIDESMALNKMFKPDLKSTQKAMFKALKSNELNDNKDSKNVIEKTMNLEKLIEGKFISSRSQSESSIKSSSKSLSKSLSKSSSKSLSKSSSKSTPKSSSKSTSKSLPKSLSKSFKLSKSSLKKRIPKRGEFNLNISGDKINSNCLRCFNNNNNNQEKNIQSTSVNFPICQQSYPTIQPNFYNYQSYIDWVYSNIFNPYSNYNLYSYYYQQIQNPFIMNPNQNDQKKSKKRSLKSLKSSNESSKTSKTSTTTNQSESESYLTSDNQFDESSEFTDDVSGDDDNDNNDYNDDNDYNDENDKNDENKEINKSSKDNCVKDNICFVGFDEKSKDGNYESYEGKTKCLKGVNKNNCSEKSVFYDEDVYSSTSASSV